MVQTILAIRSEFRSLLYYTKYMRKVKITMLNIILILVCKRCNVIKHILKLYALTLPVKTMDIYIEMYFNPMSNTKKRYLE